MERLERIYRFDRLLRTRPAISRQELEQTFEVSRATFRRDLEYLRDRLGYPIVYDAQLGGYRLEPGAGGEATVQLPGVWFSSGELHSLLALVEVLREADPGVLDRVVEAVRHRTLSLLGRKSERDYDIARRIRVLSLGHRPVSPAIFEAVTTALFERRRLRVTYALRSNGGVKEREISPQRLVRFRDNWFLDAWCHDRNGPRVLAMDAIERAAVVAEAAREVPVEALNEA
ncbi:MAG TPA: WYL domain-containing protein, partial [Gammaproteobacteria bacterium]|nr:WYL domain-containing protein [Gammaproteobacteria bacterium]